MQPEDSIINIKRLSLIKETCNKKETQYIDKCIKKIFKKCNYDTKNLLQLFIKLDNKLDLSTLKDYSIGNRQLHIVNSDTNLKKIYLDIKSEGFIGFDTEQKPTFKKGETQKSISIVQIATKKSCYIIQMKYIDNIDYIGKIISDPQIVKIGFGLKNDSKQLLKLFGTNPESFFDLATFIKTSLQSKNSIGAKNAVSLFLNLNLKKSKNAALSNWEKEKLSHSQIKYASEDATAPLDIYYEIINNFPFIRKKLPKTFNL